MAENSAISWTDHTFNPWIGCARISPACDGCYAAGLMGTAGRFGPARAVWGGPGKGEGTRTRTAPSSWAKPRKWNRDAAGRPGETFVFCASLADVFDNAVPSEWRRELFDLIHDTPNLTWLLLTKRPGNIVKLFRETLPEAVGPDDEEGEWYLPDLWPRNAAIGFTAPNQDEFDRDWPKAREAFFALQPPFLFLSDEPALGRIWLPGDFLEFGRRAWVIAGGETDQKLEDGSMHRARPADPAWPRSLRDQCAAAGVPFHFKQWGEWLPATEVGQVPHSAHHTFVDSAAFMQKAGKDRDPCTLDGVTHDARPLMTGRMTAAEVA